ncbi:MAG: hypothetical protein O3B72_08835 [Proteobacteria bacterium]|nr:hypothetical protein [Pseudomonadota bacterium]
MTTQTTADTTARQLELGITCETVEFYRYKQHRYQKLSDALKYAEIDVQRDNPDPEAVSNQGDNRE